MKAAPRYRTKRKFRRNRHVEVKTFYGETLHVFVRKSTPVHLYDYRTQHNFIKYEELDPVTIIKTTAPIPMPVLKRAFSEKVLFQIDVDGSPLTPKRLLTYVSNVKVDTELLVKSNDVMAELIVAYMESSLLYRNPELEALSMIVVMRSMGVDASFGGWTSEELDGLVSSSDPDVLQLWRIRLSSLPAWTLHIHKDTSDMVDTYPEDTVTNINGELDPRGLNFICVLDSPFIHLWIPHIRKEDIMFNKALFDGNIFAARNMFHYLANGSNPFMLAMFDLLPKSEESEDVSSS